MTGPSDAALVIESLDEPARFGEIFDRHAVSKQAYRDGSQSLPDIKKNFDELTKQLA